MIEDPLRKAQELLAEGDRCLLKGEWVQASQRYASAARILAQLREATAGLLAVGYHQLATALGAYFEGRTEKALTPLDAAVKAFKQTGDGDRYEFALGLLFSIQAEVAAENDEYHTGGKLLGTAARHLENVRSRSGDLGPACQFWLRWSRLRFLFQWLPDLVGDGELKDAREKLDEIQDLSRQLTELVPNQPHAKALYGGMAALSASIFYLGSAGEASDAEDHEKVDGYLKDANRSIEEAQAALAKLELTGALSELAGSHAYFRLLINSTGSQLRAEAAVFNGDRVAAIEIMSSSVGQLTNVKAQAQEPGSILNDWLSDIDEELEEAEEYLRILKSRDPGVFALEPEVAKILSPNLVEVVKRDIRELSNAFMQGTWMGVVVLSGAILEAILCSALQPRSTEAKNWNEAPKRQGDVKPLEEWELGPLITFAERCGLLRAGDLHISHALREFRNLIHPGKRAREGVNLGKEEADAAVSALKVAIRRLAK